MRYEALSAERYSTLPLNAVCKVDYDSRKFQMCAHIHLSFLPIVRRPDQTPRFLDHQTDLLNLWSDELSIF